jgi:putative ABC transport system permease protein
VVDVVAGQASYATVDGRRIVLEGVSAAASNVPAVGLADPAAREAMAQGRGAIITSTLAGTLGLGEGDDLVLPTPQGEQRVGVVDVVDLVEGTGGLAVVSLDRLEEWYGRPGANWFEVHIAEGADRGEVRRAVERVADDVTVPVFVFTGDASLAAAKRSVEQTSVILRTMQWVVVAAVALAMLNTLLISVIERRRELGIIRAVGASRRQVRRIVLAEASAVAAVGSVLGLAIGLVMHRVGVEASAAITGFEVDYDWLLHPLLVAVGAAVVMTLAGAALPAWRAGSVEVLDAIGYE